MMNASVLLSLTMEAEVTVLPEVVNNEAQTTILSDVIATANEKQFHVFLPTFVFICILLSFGIPGNVCTLVVYITRMRNSFARQFLVTLATCDLLTCLVVMPIELDIMNRFFLWDMRWTCKTFRWFAYFINNLANFTLLAVAIDRYRLVCQPWKQKLTPPMKSKICAMNAVLAIVTSLPMFFMYGSQNILLFKSSQNKTFEKSPNLTYTILNGSDVTDVSGVYGTSCLMDESMAGSKFPIYIVTIYIVSIVITFFVYMFLYGSVLKTLIHRRKQSMCQKKKSSRKESTNRIRKVTFLMIVLTALYEICYLPCLVTVGIRLIQPDLYGTLSQSGKTVFQLTLKSYLLCSALNPFVYGFCNKEFTSELKKLYRSVLQMNKQADKLSSSRVTKSIESQNENAL